MTNPIIDTQNIAEDRGWDEDESPQSDMAATTDPTDAKIEFHVQMRSWTQRDMEELVIEAAAIRIVDGWSDRDLSKRIEERCIEMLTGKIDAKLDGITTEIINQPVAKGGKNGEPITMEELIGLHAKDYLTTLVDNSGEPTNGRYSSGAPRVQRLVAEIISRDFKKTLEKERHQLLAGARNAIAAKEREVVEEARAQLRETLGVYLKERK